MDMTETIVPSSTQINADDLISGPVTVTIERVSPGSSEQPVDVQLVEFPGRAYRPSKSMRRVMVAAWGPDTAAYTGQRMTLYREASIRFGPDEVGGIRISHLSGIDKALKLALTVKRGKRDPFIVEPLTTAPAIPPITRDQLTELAAGFKSAGITSPDAGLAYIANAVDREVTSSKQLDRAEANVVIERLHAEAEPTLDGAE